MFSITALPTGIEELRSELVLMLESVSREMPRPDEATREFDMTPELMSLTGDWSADILVRTNA